MVNLLGSSENTIRKKKMKHSSRIAVAVAASTVLIGGLAACSNNSSASDTTVAASTTSLPHWTYEGEEGPENWGDLSPSYAACADGSAQTPIDVTNVVQSDLTDPIFDYGVKSATVINNGHTIQANSADGNSMTVDDASTPLKQIHFHSPSEHTINGKSAAAEVHFVHKTDAGVISVVGVMIVEGPDANAAWQPYVEALSTKKDTETSVELDWSAMLPVKHTTYRYTGSLTTPPCTEGVNWFLMTNPVSLSADQIAAFSAAYEGNNRPVQPLNGREIQLDTTNG